MLCDLYLISEGPDGPIKVGISRMPAFRVQGSSDRKSKTFETSGIIYIDR
jgi:hypothetical protein